MSVGGVLEPLPVGVGGGGGLSRPTSSSSMLALAAHLSRLLPGLLLVLPASRSLLRSRPSPLESALPMLRFCGDMQTSGPLHSSEAEEEDDCEDETATVVAVELGGRLLCSGVPRGSLRGVASPRTSHAATCVTGAARGEKGVPHGGCHVGGALRGAAAVAVAAADHVPRDPRAEAAAHCGHGGGPWPPDCSWSDFRAPG